METRLLGRSDLRLSLIGLGTNNFGGRLDLEATRRVVDRAIELGVNHFDTSDTYGGDSRSEKFLGEILGDRWKDVVIATKFGKPLGDDAPERRGAPAYLTAAVEASLKRLRTDRIDLLYMHEPDPGTPIAETLGALDRLVKDGKVRYLAASNFSAGELGEALDAAGRHGTAGFVATQDEYSLLHRGIEEALLPVLQTRGLGLVPFFPLGGGALTGKYRPDAMPEGARHTGSERGTGRFLEPHWDTIAKLTAFAGSRGRTLLELALSWLAARPQVVSIITGATKPEQIEANAASVGWALSAEEMAEVDRITRP